MFAYGKWQGREKMAQSATNLRSRYVLMIPAAKPPIYNAVTRDAA